MIIKDHQFLQKGIMNCHKLNKMFFLCLLFCVSVSCKPEINSFSAKPNFICQGEITTVKWDVTGSASLYADPPLASTGLVPSVGQRQFQLEIPTKFIISAFRNNYRPEKREQDVVVFPEIAKKPIISRTNVSDTGGLVAIETDVWGDISDLMLIEHIANKSDRKLIVKHGGITVEIPQNGTSEEMKGLMINGAWEMYADLKPDEVIGDPNNAPPDRLGIEVTLSCKRSQ